MAVFFVGAMPWVQLFDQDERIVWAGIVQADWSPVGTGRLVMLRRGSRWRTIGTSQQLLTWLWDWHIAPAARESGEVWERDEFEPAEVALTIDLDQGLRARAGDLEIEITEPLERQLIHRPDYPLGEFHPTASWVRVCCARATIRVGGEPLPGEPQFGTDSYGQRSTAQINVAEVWTDPAGSGQARAAARG